jgi:hypothetical protein
MDHYHASQDVREQRRTGAWKRLTGQLRDWSGTGLISHEFFSMATAEQATRAVADLAPAEVHVVLTARDYVRQFPAVWQEALKMSSNLPLDAYLEEVLADRVTTAWGWRSQDLPRVLEHWSSAVPPERIHVITVPAPGAPRDLLWHRWRSTVGLDDSGFDMSVSLSNESLGAPQAALLTRVKPHLTGPLTRKPVQHRWVRQYFGHEVLVPQRGPRFGLRPEQATLLRERAVVDVEKIRAGGYHVVGDLDDLVPGEQPPMPHPEDISEQEMLEVAGRAFDQMIRDVRKLTKERDRWRARAQRRPAAGARAALGDRLRAVRRRWSR